MPNGSTDADVDAVAHDGSIDAGDAGDLDGGEPPLTPGLIGVRDLAVGARHVCAVRDDGTVWCWGDNSGGQLGDGTGETSAIPVATAPLRASEEGSVDGAVRIATGGWHTCAGTEGRVYCWGHARFGQLALTGREPRFVPTVSRFADCSALDCTYDLAGGTGHTCALVGRLEPEPPTPPGDGGSPAAVDDLVLSVACVGDNAFGQLGDGSTSTRSIVAAVADAPHDAVAVAAGFGHTCFVDRLGAVSCFGLNTQGQLGTGDRVNSQFPAAVESIDDAVAIATGSTHTCVAHRSGTVSCWGGNARGQLGNGTPTDSSSPTVIAGLSDISKVAAGDEHTCALSRGGDVWCWGENAHGQLGDGTGVEQRAPVRVARLRDVRTLRLGGATSCAIRSDGGVFCWGKNDAGQLGAGDTESRDLPVAVTAPNEPAVPADAGLDGDVGAPRDAGDAADAADAG
jgi:alpha-tubulin suppressor-like RCC1 family protein